VLAAVIVLPMVFDPEPRGTASSVSVRIPAEDETPFAPKLPAKKAEPAPEKKTEPLPARKAESAPAPVAKEEYVVQVGAFASPQSVIARLQSAKVPYYTEAAGSLTRVRAGPFATRAAAEKALEQLKGLGFEPGNVTAKSG
jgi:DedD protein